MKKRTHRVDKSHPKDEQHLMEKELAEINTQLNRFLKDHFTIEIQYLQEYLHRVKDLLIKLTTKKASPIITNVFSKFSNILQPFTSYSYDLSLETLKNELLQHKTTTKKMNKKIINMKEEIENYRVKSQKYMDFVYMLRLNNINVDQLFQRCFKMNKRRRSRGKEQIIEGQEWLGVERRNGMDVRFTEEKEQAVFTTIDYEGNDRYASAKSKK